VVLIVMSWAASALRAWSRNRATGDGGGALLLDLDDDRQPDRVRPVAAQAAVAGVPGVGVELVLRRGQVAAWLPLALP